jgi:polyisoprenoid-binding protein YceI
MVARLSSLVLIALFAGLAGVARAAEYNIDPVHSTLIYRIKHMGTSYSYGRFNNPTGTMSYDPAAPEKTMFELTVNVNDIDSANTARDTHLKGADFFNARQFPTIRFKSTAVTRDADGTLQVTGDLTLRGVTRSLKVPLTVTGTGTGQGGKAMVGFEGTVEFRRSDFGMDQNMGAVGDEVRIIVSLEGIQK